MKTTNTSSAEWLAAILNGFHPTFRYPDGSEENKVPCVGELLWHNPINAEAREMYPSMYQASQLKGDLIFFSVRIDTAAT